MAKVMTIGNCVGCRGGVGAIAPYMGPGSLGALTGDQIKGVAIDVGWWAVLGGVLGYVVTRRSKYGAVTGALAGVTLGSGAMVAGQLWDRIRWDIPIDTTRMALYGIPFAGAGYYTYKRFKRGRTR